MIGLKPWQWAAAVVGALLLALAGLAVLMPRRRALTPLKDLGGLDSEALQEIESARVEVLELELLEADAELLDVAEIEDLDARSDEIANLIARRR